MPAVLQTQKAEAPDRRDPDPLRQFRSEMDRLVETVLGGGLMPRGLFDQRMGGRDLVVPQLELSEDPEGFRVAAELPGLDPKDVEITLSDGLLTLKGEKKSESRSDKDNLHVTERHYGSFLRQVRLPDSIDENKVAAAFDKGVLTVRLPKKPGAARGPKKIAIGKGA